MPLSEDRLFLETTRRLAPPRLAEEDARTALGLLQPLPGLPVADLGCGYGRHLRALHALAVGSERDRFRRKPEAGSRKPSGDEVSPVPGGALLGVDRSALLLAEARRQCPAARLVRADLRALPLRSGTLGAAFCFYSSMFLGSEGDAVQALREAARVLAPGARLVLTTDNPLRLAARPQSTFADDVPGLGRVEEESAFDPAAYLDAVSRRLTLPSGEILSATFRIRYYLPPELAALARAAGLMLLRLEPDAPLDLATPQLIALLARQH